MRLGEILKTIEQVVDQNSQITIKNEPLYGGQAYIIQNFETLVKAIQVLSTQTWNTADYNQIKDIIPNSKKLSELSEVSQDQFGKLTEYVNTLNQSVPIFYSILKTMVKEQEEQIINLKLPDKVKTLSDLTDLNNRLEKVFKLFQIDGDITFKEFDKGSDWYVLYANGVLTYSFFMGCLKVAQEILETRTKFYESEEARISYEAALKKSEEFNQQEFKKYCEKWLDIKIEKAVSKLIEEIKKTNGATELELKGKLIKGTADLIKELDNGAEFHLSLNPPAYAKEYGGYLEINYKQLREVHAQELEKNTKAKNIEAPKDEKTKTDIDPDSNKS